MAADEGELAADLDGLLDVANHQLTTLSGLFFDAGSTWNPYDAANAFHRGNGLPGGLSGPSGSVMNAYLKVQSVVLQTSTTLTSVAENLTAFVQDVALHDQQAAAALRKLGDRI